MKDELKITLRVQYLNDLDPFNNHINFLEPTRPLTFTFWLNIPLQNQIADVRKLLQAPHKLEDCALQLYKYTDGQGEYSTYLDLESNLQDQQDELDELINNKRNTLILRTQLCVRVQACIEKLFNSADKDLKSRLLKLKQMFQEDKDLVHEFVINDGLDCFIKLSQDINSAYLIHILKALGQIMLFIDGMNGVIEHNLTIQWLYMLVAYNLRVVVKMSLKLLLVFVEYNETNCMLLISAVDFVDGQSSNKTWSHIMRLLHDTNNSDNELLVYAMTLVNKTLAAVPDQDTFYDITDSLEEQGLEEAIRKQKVLCGKFPTGRTDQNEDEDSGVVSGGCGGDANWQHGGSRRNSCSSGGSFSGSGGYTGMFGCHGAELLEQFEIYDSLVSQEDGDVFSEGLKKTTRLRSEDELRKSRRKSADLLSQHSSNNNNNMSTQQSNNNTWMQHSNNDTWMQHSNNNTWMQHSNNNNTWMQHSNNNNNNLTSIQTFKCYDNIEIKNMSTQHSNDDNDNDIRNYNSINRNNRNNNYKNNDNNNNTDINSDINILANNNSDLSITDVNKSKRLHIDDDDDSTSRHLGQWVQKRRHHHHHQPHQHQYNNNHNINNDDDDDNVISHLLINNKQLNCDIEISNNDKEKLPGFINSRQRYNQQPQHQQQHQQQQQNTDADQEQYYNVPQQNTISFVDQHPTNTYNIHSQHQPLQPHFKHLKPKQQPQQQQQLNSNITPNDFYNDDNASFLANSPTQQEASLSSSSLTTTTIATTFKRSTTTPATTTPATTTTTTTTMITTLLSSSSSSPPTSVTSTPTLKQSMNRNKRRQRQQSHINELQQFTSSSASLEDALKQLQHLSDDIITNDIDVGCGDDDGRNNNKGDDIYDDSDKLGDILNENMEEESKDQGKKYFPCRNYINNNVNNINDNNNNNNNNVDNINDNSSNNNNIKNDGKDSEINDNLTFFNRNKDKNIYTAQSFNDSNSNNNNNDININVLTDNISTTSYNNKNVYNNKEGTSIDYENQQQQQMLQQQQQQQTLQQQQQRMINNRLNLIRSGKNYSLDEQATILNNNKNNNNIVDGSEDNDDLMTQVCDAKDKLKHVKMPLKKFDSTPVIPASKVTTPTNAAPSSITSTINKMLSNFKNFTNITNVFSSTKKNESNQDSEWIAIEKECSTLPLKIKDIDFTDLTEADETDYLTTTPANNGNNCYYGLLSCYNNTTNVTNAPPPPPMPPPILTSSVGAGLLMSGTLGHQPPPPPPLLLSTTNLNSTLPHNSTLQRESIKKKQKLHWKEARLNFVAPGGVQGETIWGQVKKEVGTVRIDGTQFEKLFELKTQDAKTKKTETKKLEVLDQKRSNAINIGLVHLPKPNAIKTAIISMDSSVLSREDIEKILTSMIPTEEELQKITELRKANSGHKNTSDSNANSNTTNNSDFQLGTAEMFLETMGSISELQPRLKLWVFKLDYDSIESEICDPLYDLKKGMDELRKSKTFRFILSTLLSLGNFLNNTNVPGFTVDYLTKVTEVKDTVYKHTLLHHLVNLIIDQFPNSGDLYSEIGSIVRCSKIDWDDVKEKLDKLEMDCKSSWNHLKAIIKHDSTFQNKHKMSDFLTSTMRRICLVKIVYKRVFNRFRKFLLWLGYSVEDAKSINVKQFCQTLSEFALEFRTTRDKVQNARIKKQNMRERKKTRGVMIVQTEKFSSKARTLPRLSENVIDNNIMYNHHLHNNHATLTEDANDLEMILQNGSSKNLFAKNRTRKSLDPRSLQKSMKLHSNNSGSVENVANTDGNTSGHDDDLLESVLRSVTKANEPKMRERRRARDADRKSLRRTLKGGLTGDELEVVNKF